LNKNRFVSSKKIILELAVGNVNSQSYRNLMVSCESHRISDLQSKSDLCTKAFFYQKLDHCFEFFCRLMRKWIVFADW
jgi:hypothetical protein